MDKNNSWTKIFVAWFEEADHSMPFADEAEIREFERQMDDDEREEQSRFGVSLEQLKWRRKMIADKCGGDPDKFRQEFPSDPVEAFLRKSRTRFNISVLAKMERAAEVRKPQVGELIAQDGGEVTFLPDVAGSVEIFDPPRYGMKYIQAVDSCTGRDQQSSAKGSDPDGNSVGIIRDEYLDPGSGEFFPPRLVALAANRLEADIHVDIAANLSRYYGKCMSVIEVNGCGLYPVKKMQELGMLVWERKRTDASTNTVQVSGGWTSSEATRKTIIDTLAGLINRWTPEDPTFECWSLKVIHQLKKFIVDSSGHPAAMPGEHDDHVMMLAIALYNRGAATEMRPPTRKRIPIDKMLRQQGWSLERARGGPGAPK